MRSKIDPSGEVNDNASPELARLRTQLRKQRARLRSTLESYLRGKDTSRYLQDQVVSDRDGRYVLVVKAEHRAAIPGIIHGSSGSGASLYLEPLSTVEINNEIVALEQQEREEVHRILAAADRRASASKPIELRQAIDAATELDVIQAKVRFAQLDLRRRADALDRRPARTAGGAPSAADPGVVARLDDATTRAATRRRAIRCRWTCCVIPPTTVLLITGPNTGGKTVALKTAGLSPLMAQAGLFVPAADARLPVFRSIFADIGDEQSIAANLSTFSWHITNIASMDRSLALPALVLLDELGAGTDPLEGGALGVAIIEHFRTRGAIVDLDDALRSAEDLRGHDAWRHGGRIRLHARHLRADLSHSVRIARPKPGARDGRPAGAERQRSSTARGRTCPSARRSSPSISRRSTPTCARSSTSGGSSSASARRSARPTAARGRAKRRCASAKRRSSCG